MVKSINILSKDTTVMPWWIQVEEVCLGYIGEIYKIWALEMFEYRKLSKSYLIIQWHYTSNI